jgi:hypothetical protein
LVSVLVSVSVFQLAWVLGWIAARWNTSDQNVVDRKRLSVRRGRTVVYRIVPSQIKIARGRDGRGQRFQRHIDRHPGAGENPVFEPVSPAKLVRKSLPAEVQFNPSVE